MQSIAIASHIYSTSGIYTDTLVATTTCDSIVITNMIINPMPIITTSLSGNGILSNQSGANYQWIDYNGNILLVGENNQFFTPSANGQYAVVVGLGNCFDTNQFVSVTALSSTLFPKAEFQINIHPNPFSISTTVNSYHGMENATAMDK